MLTRYMFNLGVILSLLYVKIIAYRSAEHSNTADYKPGEIQFIKGGGANLASTDFPPFAHGSKVPKKVYPPVNSFKAAVVGSIPVIPPPPISFSIEEDLSLKNRLNCC